LNVFSLAEYAGGSNEMKDARSASLDFTSRSTNTECGGAFYFHSNQIYIAIWTNFFKV
jgi:hypothetical protein